MQLIRFKNLTLTGIRHLYSASALGLDGFLSAKSRIKSQFHELEDKFKAKMNDFSKEDSGNMIFTEDLKHMIFLVERNKQDLDIVKKMMLKFSKQNKDIKFGSFVFGPVVMRMYHCLDEPVEALEVFKNLQSDGFFDQLISCQILMDLLFKHNMHNEVIDVFEIVKSKQLKGSKYPKNAVVLVLAACYKLNTTDSYNYVKKLWSELNEIGHYPMRRAGTFAAALAIQQKEPHVALEILTSMKQQSYVTLRNLKISALADLGRPDDALPLLRAVLESDRPNERKSSVCEEVIVKMKDAVMQFGRSDVTEEYVRIEKHLKNANHIDNVLLDELLCSEIALVSMDKHPNQRRFGKQPPRYNLRPGLPDII